MDGVPPSEAALRRWRRQRRRAAALGTCFGESAMPGTACGSLGAQNSSAGTYVPGEFGGSGGGCDGDGFLDVRQQVVVALRCLAGALELQGCDWGHFANQQVWTEDSTMAADGVFPGTVANERLGFSPSTVGADVSRPKALPEPDKQIALPGLGGSPVKAKVLPASPSRTGLFTKTKALPEPDKQIALPGVGGSGHSPLVGHSQR